LTEELEEKMVELDKVWNQACSFFFLLLLNLNFSLPSAFVGTPSDLRFQEYSKKKRPLFEERIKVLIP
jgi:hypothetical protein